MGSLEKRHQQILDLLKKESKVSVHSLKTILGVSEVTIRKDLSQLEESGFLFRHHGGATLENPYAKNRSLSEKSSIKREVKERIAKAAADLIGDADSIILGSGSTVQAMAKYIQPMQNLNAISCSLETSVSLVNKPNVEVTQLGGLIRKSSSSVVGPYAEQLLSQITTAYYFLGVDGIDIEFGLTTTHLLEAQLNQKCMAISSKTIILADSSKFGKRGFGRIGSLEQVTTIITDTGLSEQYLKEIELMGVKVLLV